MEPMSDKEKLDAVLNLLTDSTIGKLRKAGTLANDEEAFGGMVTLTHVFGKAYKIARGA